MLAVKHRIHVFVLLHVDWYMLERKCFDFTTENWHPMLFYRHDQFAAHAFCHVFLININVYLIHSHDKWPYFAFMSALPTLALPTLCSVSVYRCNRLKCPLAGFSDLHCYNMCHNGHGIMLPWTLWAINMQGDITPGGLSVLVHRWHVPYFNI